MRLAALPIAIVPIVVLIAGPAPAQETVSADTIAVEWTTTVHEMEPDPLPTFVAVCPPGGSAEGSLNGTDTYTSDSSICLAAVHAGALTLTEGGPVVVLLVPGLDEYPGTTRNGVTSQSWATWHSSFRFPSAPKADPDTAMVPEPPIVHQLQGDWYTRANQITAPQGAIVRLQCTAGGTGGNVWGTDIYTDDSSVCEAAVHAGVITRTDGGTVHFELLGEQASFTGSQRNGVSTMRYPAWPGSFRFVEIEEG